MNEDKNKLQVVRELLKQDQTREAIDLLFTFAEEKNQEHKDLVVYSASLSRVRQSFFSSLIPFETYHSELTKIVLGLLNFLEVAFTVEYPRILEQEKRHPSGTYVSESAKNYVSEPIQPSVSEPIQPIVSEPIQPSVSEPIQPSVSEPIQPSVSKPIGVFLDMLFSVDSAPPSLTEQFDASLASALLDAESLLQEIEKTAQRQFEGVNPDLIALLQRQFEGFRFRSDSIPSIIAQRREEMLSRYKKK